MCAGLPTPHALQATVQKQAGQGDLSVSGFGGVGRPAPDRFFHFVAIARFGRAKRRMAFPVLGPFSGHSFP